MPKTQKPDNITENKDLTASRGNATLPLVFNSLNPDLNAFWEMQAIFLIPMTFMWTPNL